MTPGVPQGVSTGGILGYHGRMVASVILKVPFACLALGIAVGCVGLLAWVTVAGYVSDRLGLLDGRH